MILAILDDLLFTSKIKTAAKQVGVAITIARSRESALADMRAHRPSLVVLDLNNPRTDPLGTIAAMKADAALATIPTVGFASHVQTEVIEAARAAGVGDVMARSLFIDRLPQILARGLSSSSVTSPTSLLRTNRNFRLLYFGQAISQLGDWFNSVAVFALLLDLTGSATAVAWMLIMQFLPMAIVGPVAGVVVDRVDRRRLMIGADLFRGVMILGLLLVQRADQYPIAYVVVAVCVSAQAFFEPARTATIPNITSADELMPANALSSATWSAMLAIGASVGGLVTALSGRNVAFVLNAASFFASAILISRTRYDSTPPHMARPAGLAALTGIPDLLEGFRYIRRRSHVAALMFVKAGWGLAGGVLLLLTIFGERVFPVGPTSAGGIGVLYGARGIGAGLGPIALRWILGQKPATLRRTIGPAYFVVGVFYILLAGAPTLPLAALAVLCAHFGGSILWVFSTVLLQMEVPDRFRGRVFAVELALVTLTSSISSYVTAYALDRMGWSPRAMAFALGTLFCVPGLLWLLIASRWRQGPEIPEQPEQTASGEEEVLEGRVG